MGSGMRRMVPRLSGPRAARAGGHPAQGQPGDRHRNGQSHQVDDVDGADVEEVARARTAIEHPQARAGEEGGHRHRGRVGQSAFVAEDTGRERRPGARAWRCPRVQRRGRQGSRPSTPTSPVGKPPRAAGCIQYEVTNNVEAHAYAATPPGTMPWCAHGCPPVPGQPLAKWCVPTTRMPRPTMVSSKGRRRRPLRSRTSRVRDGPRDGDDGGDAQRADRDDRHRHHEHGGGRGCRVRCRPLPADGELGPDGEGEHDEDGQRRADRDQAATLPVHVVEGLPAQARGGGARHHGVARRHRATASERTRSLLHVGDEQFDELVAVAGAPFLRVPAEQALCPVLEVRFRPPHAGPHVPARRRSPRSAILRWVARWERSASAPTAVSL